MSLRVLITRPPARAQTLAQAIEQQGGQAFCYPVMAIKALDTQADQAIIAHNQAQLGQLNRFQQLIFISANAVHKSWPWLAPYPSSWSKSLICHTMGAATEQALQQYALPQPQKALAAAMNSETLLQHPALQHVAGQHVLIVRGVGGRTYLAEQLQKRGAQVAYIACYRRVMADKPIGELGHCLVDRQFDAVVITSVESLEYFVTLVGLEQQTYAQQLKLVVPSQRVADIARRLGFSTIKMADNASCEAMMAALSLTEHH